MPISNLNPIRTTNLVTLLAPRNGGRGQCLTSTGILATITHSAGFMHVNTTPLIAEAQAPAFLDFAYDSLDRPQITWQRANGESLVYFYDGTLENYHTLSLGYNSRHPAIATDYRLGGDDTVLVYLKDSAPHYRLQSDRFTIEYQWSATKYVGIKALGIGSNTNSMQVVLG